MASVFFCVVIFVAQGSRNLAGRLGPYNCLLNRMWGNLGVDVGFQVDVTKQGRRTRDAERVSTQEADGVTSVQGDHVGRAVTT